MQSATSYSMSEIPLSQTNYKEIDFFTKIQILQGWARYSSITYLSNKFRYDKYCILSIIGEGPILRNQWKHLEPLESHSGYHSPFVVAVELVVVEWLKRARHNRLHVTDCMFERSTEFIMGHIGHYDLKYQKFSIYLMNKYQRTRTLRQSMEEATEGYLSTNFGDIINDLRKYFGDNIIYPNGPRYGASNDYDYGTDKPTTSTFDNPLYVTLELILSEWVKRALYNGDYDGIVQCWFAYIVKYAARCIELYFVDPVWTDRFANKYKLSRIMAQPKTKYKSLDSLKKDLAVTINEIIKDFRQQFGSNMIRPVAAVHWVCTEQTPTTSRKCARESSLSTTVNNSDSTLREASSWIMNTPSYIALELILSEWLRRALNNQVLITQRKMYRCVELATARIRFDDPNRMLQTWWRGFIRKYKVSFKRAPLSTKFSGKDRSSLWSDHIIKDLCDQYGKNIILAQPVIDDQNIDSGYATEISRMRAAFFLIVEEWVKRCQHNGFIITGHNLAKLTKSMVAYLKFSNDRTILHWTREAEIKFVTRNVFNTTCPCDIEFQPTNVYLIVKYLGEVHGEEKIPSCSSVNMEDVETIERRMAPKSVRLQDVDSSSSLWLNGPASSNIGRLDRPSNVSLVKRKRENDCDNNVSHVKEIRLTSDIDTDTESLVEVYITEVDSNDASEFIQMDQADTVKTEPELNDAESASQNMREICDYHDALAYLRPLEQFLLTHEDMRAVGLVNQLENMLMNRAKN